MRREKPVTEPTTCRSCGADVYWVEWPRSGKRMPVDSTPDNRPPPNGGTLVLRLQGGEHGKLVVEKYSDVVHDKNRNRYTSHFATCPNSDEWRRD